MVLGRHVGDSFATTVTTMPIICSCISELLEVAVPQNRILHDVALINSGHHFVLYICLLGMTGIEDHWATDVNEKSSKLFLHASCKVRRGTYLPDTSAVVPWYEERLLVRVP